LKTTNSAFKYATWPVQNVAAFSTTIHHPNYLKQSSPYGNFNLGLHVGDNKATVNANRDLLLEYLPSATSIQWLDQVHGSHVEVVKKCSNPLIADASITSSSEVALAIMTADCLPILISNINGSEVAAIHAGWKPLSKNIIENTIQAMQTSPEALYVWLGPCIGPNKFEVGEDVYQQFKQLNSDLSHTFLPKPHTNSQKYLANLQLIAKTLLTKVGIKFIYTLPECTFSLQNDYYSFRRNNKTGRMATIISRI